jgi:hypothetical protein
MSPPQEQPLIALEWPSEYSSRATSSVLVGSSRHALEARDLRTSRFLLRDLAPTNRFTDAVLP